MCMNNVNVNINLFASVNQTDGIMEFIHPFNQITSKIQSAGRNSLGSFSVVSDFNLLSTNSVDKQSDNIVYCNEKLEVQIRLAKVSSEVDQKLSLELDRFTIDTSDEKLRNGKACIDYINYKRITSFKENEIILDSRAGLGDYVIKIYLRKVGNETPWILQSIYELVVV